jgi:hypothetical protein
VLIEANKIAIEKAAERLNMATDDVEKVIAAFLPEVSDIKTNLGQVTDNNCYNCAEARIPEQRTYSK